MTDWILPPDFPENYLDYAGFTYIIRDTDTGRAYIGKKSLKTNRKVGRKRVIKESAWRAYWGSCAELLIEIKVRGPSRFERRILALHPTEAILNYEEVAEQIRRDVLRAKLPDGSPAYWNNQINGRWYARNLQPPS